MTARTLEEIEALAADATPGPWERLDCGLVCAVDSLTVCAMFNREDDDFPRADANGALIAELPRLLAIAQEQRAEIERLKRAIIELRDGVSWGEGVRLTYYTSDASAESVETIHQVTGE